MRTITYRRLLVAGLAALALAGCGTPAPAASPAAAPPADTASAATGPERPADDEELATGTTHRFPDLLPGALGVEIDLTEPMIFPYSAPAFVFLGGDPEGTDVVTFMDADGSQMLADPMKLPPLGEIDEAMWFVDVPPGELLGRLAAIPSLEVTTPERAVTVAGTPGTAIDVRVPEFPAGTAPCADDLPPCLGIAAVPDNLYYVVAGQEVRIAVLDHPAGRVLVLQNLQEPRAQAVLDTTRFVAAT